MKKKILIIGICISVFLAFAVYAWIDTIGSSTSIKKAHLDEIRSRIDALRADIGLGGYSWTDPTITLSTPVKAVHFSELRTALDSVYSTTGIGSASWTGTISSGSVPSSSHLIEPRTNMDTANSSINSLACCGSYGGLNTGSTGACPGTDDSACGTIDCDGLDSYSTSGSASSTGTNYCVMRDYQDITTNRCEGAGDCKDANSADCTSYSDSTVATCGYCCYASGACSSCSYYSSGTQGGPNSDYYYTSGGASPTGTNYCVRRDYHCTGNSCAQTYTDTTVASCGTCRYASGACSSCSNYAQGTSCGSDYYCDGSGNCVHNEFVNGWTNGAACGGVQPGGISTPVYNYIGSSSTRFGCGVICTNNGADCCSKYSNNCYEGSTSGWTYYPPLTGWWASNG